MSNIINNLKSKKFIKKKELNKNSLKLIKYIKTLSNF